MHKLPTEDARFQQFLSGIREAREAGLASGNLPPYPVFVDRLFKEMPMVPLNKVMALIKEIADGSPDGKLHVDGLLRTLASLDNPHGSALHAAVGCAGEGGELLDCVKKVFIYGKAWDTVDKKTGQTALENLIEEMGDFRFYYQKLLNMLGLTDEDIQAHNYVKLRERYSSGVYTDAHALERADKAKEPQFVGHTLAGLPPAPEIPRHFIGKPHPLPQRRKDDQPDGGAK